MRSTGVFMACAGVLLSLTAAYGLPKRIIILRHAEKIDGGGLCHIGERRAVALKEQYLGKGAQNSLFEAGESLPFLRDHRPFETHHPADE